MKAFSILLSCQLRMLKATKFSAFPINKFQLRAFSTEKQIIPEQITPSELHVTKFGSIISDDITTIHSIHRYADRTA